LLPFENVCNYFRLRLSDKFNVHFKELACDFGPEKVASRWRYCPLFIIKVTENAALIDLDSNDKQKRHLTHRINVFKKLWPNFHKD